MMLRVRRGWMVALAAVGVMAGCSDSLDDQAGYDALADEFDDLLDASEGVDFTDPATLPGSGSATYDGVMGLSTDGSDGLPSDMVGEMTLRADFGADSLSGSVQNVSTSSDEGLDGSLAISDGAIDRDVDLEEDYTYDFDLAGTLTDDDGTDLEVSAVGVGDFLGDDFQQATGTVSGVLSSDAGTSLLDGGYIVER